MKAIIPLGGKGTRMRPHTLTTPKALLHVAGKPILGHILERVLAVGIEDVVFVIGYLGDQIREYVEEHYDLNATFVVQEDPLGLGHAISLTKDVVGDAGALIIYGDTLFEADLSDALTRDDDGAIGTLHVDDARPYGIVRLEGEKVTMLIEKPPEKKPGEVIVGVNIIRNSRGLYEALDKLIREDVKTKGEYQLTDAFQLMVEGGAHFTNFPIKRWYDCGNAKGLLETNRELLAKKGEVLADIGDCTIIPPVHIPKDAQISNSIIGPNVSVGAGSVIKDAKLSDSILHPGAIIVESEISHSLIGKNATVRGFKGVVNIGDFSKVS